MKERPILFSAPMVRALLDGKKTQTRRIIKPQPIDGHSLAANCPYGRPGDRLWVKETWRSAATLDDSTPVEIGLKLFKAGHHLPHAPIEYQADRSRRHWEPGSLPQETGRARSPIHMPRWASRLQLEIVAARVERLQDISEADAVAEGMQPTGGRPAVESYRELFEAINGAGAWEANPWIWVVEFRKVKG